MKRRVIVFMGLLIMLLPVNLQARTKTMPVYDEVIKEGKYVYCSGFSGLYRLNWKSGKKKTYKRTPHPGVDDGISCMKKKGSYLYYQYYDTTGGTLLRLNVNTGKKQTLQSNENKKVGVDNYVISGSKIYYHLWDVDDETSNPKAGNYVMNLNGKSKKRTSVNANYKEKKTNAKGWKIVQKKKKNKYYEYLKTPKKRYYLGWFTSPW